MDPEDLLVDTRTTKAVVVDALTRDILVKHCIFDLIDNAVDAARESVPASVASGGPLSSRAIQVTLSPTQIVISDNCDGIDPETFTKFAFRFGQPSSHEGGIGAFGVGLNRAIFKLARRATIVTSTGLRAIRLDIDVDDYLRDDDNWMLPATSVNPVGPAGTKVSLGPLADGIGEELKQLTVGDSLAKEISARYGRFIAEGLQVYVNGARIEPRYVSFRADSKFGLKHKQSRELSSTLSFQVECGEHANHLFQGEKGYSKVTNKAIVEEYGWTIYCNDRAVLVSDRSNVSGWENFHTEYYGFVGQVRFYSTDPRELPWTTSKGELDKTSYAYRSALIEMEKMNRQWKRFADGYKLERSETSRSQSSAAKSAAVQTRSMPSSGDAGPRGPARSNALSPQSSLGGSKVAAAGSSSGGPMAAMSSDCLLPADLEADHLKGRLRGLVAEGLTLNVDKYPYAAVLLLRTLLETAITRYGWRHKKNIRQFVARKAKQNPDADVTAEVLDHAQDAKSISVTLDQMLRVFKDRHSDIWIDEIDDKVRQTVQHINVSKINQVVHADSEITGTSARQHRDDSLSFLRALIERGLI